LPQIVLNLLLDRLSISIAFCWLVLGERGRHDYEGKNR
jgi:hypothetical protein